MVDIPWVICTGNFSYQPTMADERTYVYPNIISGGARVLIFNGEADACGESESESESAPSRIAQERAQHLESTPG